MIKILDNTLALDYLVNDQSNGLGYIRNISGEVVEELNGIYEATFTVAQSEEHFNLLSVGGIVAIDTADGQQMFRIYKMSKPINGIVTVLCQHITYDLTKVVVLPFSAVGSAAACSGMVSHIAGGTYPFYMSTDIGNASSEFTLDRPRSFRECLGGYSGSLLDVFRGEYKWDNLEVQMLAHRGDDIGVTIAYGKNLTDFRQEENNQSVYTSVLGYAIVDEQTYYGDVYHKIAASYPKVKIVDFSSDYESGMVPTTVDLTNKATQYANNNDIEVPNVNITVSFAMLGQTNEYKDIAHLEDVKLGDTVHVLFEKMGVTATSKVIKTTWDINLQRYTSVELGNTRASLSSVINETVNQVTTDQKEATSFVQSEMNAMASLIINGLGLHRTLVPKANGGYTIYLHNKETLAQSDTQYVFGANGFMVSTDYGQTWNAGFDASGNAVVNSLSTIVLRALEIYGSRITFGDENDKYITAGVYTQNGDAVGVSFDGSGYVRFRPKETFQVQNLDASDNVLNSLQMQKAYNSGGSAVRMYNYNSDYSPGNSLTMYSDLNGEGYNQLWLQNEGVNSVLGNMLSLYAKDGTSKMAYLTNFKYNSEDSANQLVFNSRGTQNVATITNMDLNSTNLANQIQATAGSTANQMQVRNYDLSGNLTNGLEFYATNSSTYTNLSNYAFGGGVYPSTDVWMGTDANQSYIRMMSRGPSPQSNVECASVNVYGKSDYSGWASMVASNSSGTSTAHFTLYGDEGDVWLYNSKMLINDNRIVGNLNGGAFSDKSITSGSWQNIGSVTLGAGQWLVIVHVAWSGNASGTRAINLSSSSGSGTPYTLWLGDSRMAVVNTTYTRTSIVTTLTLSGRTTLYLNAFQNSGSSLTAISRYAFIPIPNY